MDKHRILVIILNRLLKKLIIEVQESLDANQSPYLANLNVFMATAEEYLLLPMASVQI